MCTLRFTLAHPRRVQQAANQVHCLFAPSPRRKTASSWDRWMENTWVLDIDGKSNVKVFRATDIPSGHAQYLFRYRSGRRVDSMCHVVVVEIKRLSCRA
jgi:hypothetical protein